MRPRLAFLLLLVFATPVRAYDAATNYALNCQGCHLADGSGTPGKVPALAGSLGRFLRVPGGREFLVRVPGVAGARLDDASLAALLEWTIARFDPTEHAPYTAAEVGHLRAQPLVDVTSERRRLLGGSD